MFRYLRSRSESSFRSAFVLLIATALLLSAVAVGETALNENQGALLALYGIVLALTFATQVSEVYFAKPNDIVVNAITCLVAMLPLRTLLIDSPFYWMTLGFAVVALLSALVSNVLFDPARGTTQKGASYVFMKLAQAFGNGRMLFGLCAFLLMLKVQHHTLAFGSALIVVLILLLITPANFTAFVERVRNQETSEGVIVQTLGNDRIRAKMSARPSPLAILAVQLAGQSRHGLVGRSVQGPTSADVDICLFEDGSLPEDTQLTSRKMRDGEVCVVGDLSKSDVALGTVTEGTTVSALTYRPLDGTRQAAGDIVAARVGGRDVFYQLQGAEIGIEPTVSSDKGEFVQVRAAQLGVWNPEREVFDREGWIPQPNSLVRKPTNFPEPHVGSGEAVLGMIPGTGFQVSMNVREAITHHTAVLGVTGSGKSVFVREFIRNVASERIKFICVDITGEYLVKILGTIPLMSEAARAGIAVSIEEIAQQQAEYKNKRDNAKIRDEGLKVLAAFKKRIVEFLKSDKSVTVLQMADLEGTMQNYEYLKWFFKAVFQVAKDRAGKSETTLCLVLEEAHTIVPEWNFLGDADKTANNVVNSISQIALQGRKYGVGLLVVAQRTANVSKTVLTQCNTVICFQQFDRTSFEFLNSFMSGDAESVLPNLKLRTAVAAGKAIRSTAPLVFGVPHAPSEDFSERGNNNGRLYAILIRMIKERSEQLSQAKATT